MTAEQVLNLDFFKYFIFIRFIQLKNIRFKMHFFGKDLKTDNKSYAIATRITGPGK